MNEFSTNLLIFVTKEQIHVLWFDLWLEWLIFRVKGTISCASSINLRCASNVPSLQGRIPWLRSASFSRRKSWFRGLSLREWKPCLRVICFTLKMKGVGTCLWKYLLHHKVKEDFDLLFGPLIGPHLDSIWLENHCWLHSRLDLGSTNVPIWPYSWIKGG